MSEQVVNAEKKLFIKPILHNEIIVIVKCTRILIIFN